MGVDKAELKISFTKLQNLQNRNDTLKCSKIYGHPHTVGFQPRLLPITVVTYISHILLGYRFLTLPLKKSIETIQEMKSNNEPYLLGLLGRSEMLQTTFRNLHLSVASKFSRLKALRLVTLVTILEEPRLANSPISKLKNGVKGPFHLYWVRNIIL